MSPEPQIALWHRAALLAGALRPRWRIWRPWPDRQAEAGISVIIPSRNGKDLLEAQMAGIVRDLAGSASEIVVVDNGSDDGTAEWLRSAWPRVELEQNPVPLSFARAVNLGIARARYSHVCLLNNDMQIEPGFFAALAHAFERVPELFCSTAQIFFPEGVRREETGKAVYFQSQPHDFPIRCDVPVKGEDLTYVLYGSGGCSLYDVRKLRTLGGIDEAYGPAYVEDLDVGYRAWQRGWPTVYVAGARLEHRHRATSSRFYSEEQLEQMLEVNYLKFVARAVASPAVFRNLWAQALTRLQLRADRAPARRALRAAPWIAIGGGPARDPDFAEDLVLGLGSGAVAVFPAQAWVSPTGVTVTVGRADPDVRWSAPPNPGGVMVEMVERLEPPPAEVLGTTAEVVMVLRSRGAAAFRAALLQTLRKWRPETVVLNGKEMAEYAGDCAPARVLIP